jgi:hypothetical protein
MLLVSLSHSGRNRFRRHVELEAQYILIFNIFYIFGKESRVSNNLNLTAVDVNISMTISIVSRRSSPGRVKNSVHVVQTDSAVHPNSYEMGAEDFTRGKAAGA